MHNAGPDTCIFYGCDPSDLEGWHHRQSAAIFDGVLSNGSAAAIFDGVLSNGSAPDAACDGVFDARLHDGRRLLMRRQEHLQSVHKSWILVWCPDGSDSDRGPAPGWINIEALRGG